NRLIQGATDHNLYGVTQEGGAHGWGTLFKLTLAGVCTRVASFSINDARGTANPPVQSGTSFYLTSFYGGLTSFKNNSNGYGAGMSITSAGVLKVIQSFYQRDTYNPYSSLVQVGTGSSAAFYGVSQQGGEFNGGAIFKINSSGAVSVIHNFNNYLNE